MQSQLWCKATLQYPTVNQLPLESVGDMLTKATNLVSTANFQWSYIDKPADGSIFLVYIQAGTPAPPDGYMYMDSEQPYTMNIQGKMIEIWEHKYGFTPGQEHVTSRSRRRFRLGGKPPNDVSASLWLLFYSRTDENTRVQANPMQARPQPIRKYPLPILNTKPFNLFSALPGQAQLPTHSQQMQQQYQMQQMHMQAQQAAKAQAQAQALRKMKPQQQQQQYVKRPYPSQVKMRPGETIAETPPQFDEPVPDDLDLLTPRDVARSRFVKYHDWMDEVLSVYPTHKIAPSKYDQPDESELEQRITETREEMDAMKRDHAIKLESIRNPDDEAQRSLKSAMTRLSQVTAGDHVSLDAMMQIVNA